MEFKSINPYNGEEVGTYIGLSDAELDGKLSLAKEAFKTWKKVPLEERAKLMTKAAAVIKDNVEKYAKMITLEMGKPISEARGEVSKCVWVCEYYAENAKEFLADEVIETDAQKSFVKHDPIGAVFAVMPWNFPFWQVFRFAAPNLMAGNVGVLSHAPISTGAALAIEAIFQEAGCPKGVFTSLVIDVSQSPKIIANPNVAAVTLTGSERAGKAVATDAAAVLKKAVLELGGSDPYLILKDADIPAAAKTCVIDRMLVSGQVCISAKRLIAVESVYDEFLQCITEELKAYRPSDPMQDDCNFGPMAREDLRDQLAEQVEDSIKAGASCLMGGKIVSGKGFYYEPTLLVDVKPGMPAYDQELFGPVVCLLRAKDEEDAIRIANDSPYGLGAAVFTQDLARGEKIAAEKIVAGLCAVNNLVASDPRLPFGGTKLSGFGRECAEEGIREFMNIKTVMVK